MAAVHAQLFPSCFGNSTAVPSAKAEINARINTDAQLGSRLIRAFAKDWLGGEGRFASACRIS